MNRILLLLGVALLLTPPSTSGSDSGSINIDILGFELIQRNQEDNIQSVVICSENGWKNFTAMYPVAKDYSIPDFEGDILIVSLNDRISEDVTGVILNHKTKQYLTDHADSRKAYKIRSPPEGMKYTRATIIRAKLDCTISYLAAGGMVYEGLFKRFE